MATLDRTRHYRAMGEIFGQMSESGTDDFKLTLEDEAALAELATRSAKGGFAGIIGGAIAGQLCACRARRALVRPFRAALTRSGPASQRATWRSGPGGG